ncbi:MAG: hypothetical protein NTU98_09465 [Bacteroidetes bacterium]|nr:hypothetical protein [Bacteroidota bacterium]
MNLIKRGIFILILLLLIFPAVQRYLSVFKPKPLNGYFVPRSEPALTVSSWFSGAYQDSTDLYMKENAGFRSDFVRLYNQADFSLFSLPHAGKIVVGKKGYLFSDEYIHAWLGDNFPGKSFCDEKVKMLKQIQDLLWNEKKILLVVILTPDKGTYYPEYIPGRYLKKKREFTNYGYYAGKCKEAGINLIDFNRWALLAKDTSRFPLYPKTGIHWSDYCAVLAADSLAKYLRARLDRPVPKLVLDGLEQSSTARNTDYDIENTLNLIWGLSQPAFGYFNYHFVSDTNRKKPSALFIGDSFYWNWYPAVIRGLFSNEEFWYYNMDVYPEARTKPKSVSEIDVAEAIDRQNVIVLMQVNGAKGNPGYGFVDLALSVLDKSKGDELKKVEDDIRNTPEWMKKIVDKAAQAHITVEEQLRMDALYMLDLQKLEKQKKNKQPK